MNQTRETSSDAASVWPQSRGLLILLGAVLLVTALIVLADRSPWDWQERLMWFALLAFYGTWVVLLTLAILTLSRRWWQKRPLGVVMFGAWARALVMALLLLGLARWWLAWPIGSRHILLVFAVALFLGMFVWLMVSAALIQARQARTLLEARYDALVARLEPHFLFNALNTIAALLPHRAQEAETTLEALANLLRAVLAAPTHWSLAEESEMVRSYLAIESLRFGPRLKVCWEISQTTDLQAPMVPRGVLLPLVENAVRHGLKLGPTELVVRLEAALAQGVTMEVRDHVVLASPLNASGPKRQNGKEAGFGLGLATVRALVESSHGTLTVTEDSGTFRVQVWLPWMTKDACLDRRG